MSVIMDVIPTCGSPVDNTFIKSSDVGIVIEWIAGGVGYDGAAPMPAALAIGAEGDHQTHQTHTNTLLTGLKVSCPPEVITSLT